MYRAPLRSSRWCWGNPDRNPKLSYHFISQPEDKSEPPRVRPFFSKSIKCCNGCRKTVLLEDRRRMREGQTQLYDPDDVLYLVLTIDRFGTQGGEVWPDVKTAMREIGKRWARLKQRLARPRKRGLRYLRHGFDIKYIRVIESHPSSGWPHLNVLIACPRLARLVEAQQALKAADIRARHDAAGHAPDEPFTVAEQRDCLLIHGFLRKHAVDVGFGPQSTIEIARDPEAIARYMGKLASNIEGTIREVEKLTQLPLQMEPKMRRITGSKGMLARRRKGPRVRGGICRYVGTEAVPLAAMRAWEAQDRRWGGPRPDPSGELEGLHEEFSWSPETPFPPHTEELAHLLGWRHLELIERLNDAAAGAPDALERLAPLRALLEVRKPDGFLAYGPDRPVARALRAVDQAIAVREMCAVAGRRRRVMQRAAEGLAGAFREGLAAVLERWRRRSPPAAGGS